MFERNLRDGEMPYADLIVYPICPTHSTPHTYPMLDPDPAMRDGDDGKYVRARVCMLGSDGESVCTSLCVTVVEFCVCV